MKKKRMVLVMAVSAMCMMAGCGNTVKDGTEALEQGDYDTAIASFEEAAGSDDKEEAAEGKTHFFACRHAPLHVFVTSDYITNCRR